MVSVRSEAELKERLIEGSKFYLYGAGIVYRKIIAAVSNDIIAVIDKNRSEIIPLNDVAILSPEDAFICGEYDVICGLNPELQYDKRTQVLAEELEKYDVKINLFLLDVTSLEDEGVLIWGDRKVLFDNRKYLISGKSDFVKKAYSPEVIADAKYLERLNEEPCAFVLRGNGIGFEDFDNGLIVHAQGRKDWNDSKELEFTNRILLFGDSRVSGMLLENRHTIAANLQRKIDKNGIKYKVENYAIPGRDIERMVWQIKNEKIDAGDVVVLGSGFYEFENADENVLVWGEYLREANDAVLKKKASFIYMNLPTMLELADPSPEEADAVLMFHSTEFLDYTPEKLKYYKNILQIECASNGICFIDMAAAFAYRSKYGQVFINLHHYGPHGTELIADELTDYIIALTNCSGANLLHETAIAAKRTRSSGFEDKLVQMKKEDDQIFEFVDELKMRMERKWGDYGDLGCIVMNANPFTKGHLYLVKEALKLCGKLLILVVEEDLSEIPFKDRYQIVIDNTASMNDVFVAPSGTYSISKSTFPDYFEKEKIQGKKINAETDVRIFAERIAPRLGIKKRFVGEEPTDGITRQYNETMKRIFKGYGIELVEIPRLQIDKKIVSATEVRKNIKNGDMGSISEFVTPKTHEYILSHEVFLK
ncbi:adenylyltransferase/cytidyltransferase family protein [Butyrivibrio sp. NC2007]|uniref:adenylyltransferase/cytidyltransferase family protein n=1 Tax=Butyrivibrio sp. NC2007 TaxID=1280683 RepID=UPI0003B3E2DC|nr:adenylyltransferase/cytidyltransferase family protein [Butyrivibrio sp. NC2007]